MVAAAFPKLVHALKERRSRAWPRTEASLVNFGIFAQSLQRGPLFARYNPLHPDKFFMDRIEM
jgi:hypothetical protein